MTDLLPLLVLIFFVLLIILVAVLMWRRFSANRYKSSRQQTLQKNENKKPIYNSWLFYIAVILMAVGAAIGDDIAKDVSSTNLGTNDRLSEISEQLNSTLPKTLNSELRIDTTIPLPGNKLLYKYTLLNSPSEEIADEFVNKDEATRIYCTTPGMQPFRDSGVILVYSYYLADGTHLLDISVDPEDC